ncbi:MAG TPA: prolyl oligopeptidase family serine peptidase [Rhodanobacteraceae bacterium]|nr:prolyl oligopeptidase family serine peptidase [Rhodanobacteraceae bacterium]
MRLAFIFALAAIAVSPAFAATQQYDQTRNHTALIDEHVPQPPASPKHPASTVMHGVRVADPYRWLEDGDAPKVKKWIKAQNTYTEHMLAMMPAGKTMAERVRELAITSTTRSAPLMAGGTLFYLQETPPQPQPVLMARHWPNGKAHVLVDLNQQQGLAITGYWPSPSGRYLAYGTARGGSELTTIHVLDVKTGKPLDDVLPWAGGGTSPQGLAWDADEKGFIYVRFPPPAGDHTVTQFHAALVHHVLGQPADDDRVVFGKDYSPIAEYQLPTSPGGKHLAVLAKTGDGGPWEIYVQRDGKFVRVIGKQANVRGASWDGDRLLVESFQDAPRGKVLAIDPDSGKISQVLGERKGALQQLAPVGKGFIVVRSWGPDWWAEQYTHDGGFVRRLPLPKTGISIGGIASESGQSTALITYGGWTLPSRWAEYDASNGTLKTVFEVKPAADYSNVVATRIEGVSKDGTKIPVTVLHLKNITPNGKRPTILYSYGGFDIPIRPGFIGAKLAWLEKGGVYAYANIRGGNENGQTWHREGQKTRKQNVFDDFFAAAEALKKSGWTDTRHLGIMGGSNGGLLMGAELTQHSEAFRAVVANVGIYDVIRHETQWANGAYNVPEYGTIKDAVQFKATLAYSPLQNVKPNTAYPAVLMTTGVNDPRVAPWQSRKFTAALQNASTSGHPILLLTRMHAGHGIDASFAQRVGNTAIALTFFAHELGLTMQP